MTLYVRSDPWAKLVSVEEYCGHGKKELRVDGRGSPQIILPAGNSKPRLGPHNMPPCGFPFVQGESRMQAFSLPVTSEFSTERHDAIDTLDMDGRSLSIRQTNLIGRPNHNRESENSPLTEGRRRWLNWQIQRYSELSDIDTHGARFEVAFRNHCVRRNWESVQNAWIRPENEEPKISLIVKLAKDDQLIDALCKIAANPRKILERYRENTQVNRIQELDAACIQDYAKRPGRLAEEKAGSKQALLAVNRRERIDTLENRLTHWVLHRMKALANEWLYQHAHLAAASYDRINRVRKLLNLVNICIQNPNFASLPPLTRHPDSPNYPLQFEKRYSRIWLAYLKIRQEMKIHDDSWTWQRAMWSESGRQIFHCALKNRKGWREMGESTPTYRPEGFSGNWLIPYRAPGPFKVASGSALLFDSLDILSAGLSEIWLQSSFFEDSKRIGASGCEQVLWFPEKGKGLAIWYALMEPQSTTLEDVALAATSRLNEALCGAGSVLNWKTLVIAALLNDESNHKDEVDIFELQDQGSYGLLIPMESHRHAVDVIAGINLAIEAIELGI